jgi:hypothetical protein
MNNKIRQLGKKAGLDDHELRGFFRIGLSGLVALVLSLFTGPVTVAGSDKADLLKAIDPPRAKENLPEKCRLKPDRGLCKGLFWKYHFDQKSAACKEFMYGGCDGVVPFETREECELACLEQKAEPGAAADVGADLLPEAPDPYGFKTVEVGSYFRCEIPPDWLRGEGAGFGLTDEEKKTYGITLTAPESGEVPVRISLYYYAEGNLMYKTLDHYLNLFAKPALGVVLAGSSYGEVTPAKVGGREGMMFERLKQEFVPLHNRLDLSDSPGREGVVYERRREMMARAVPVKERFMVLPAKSGFYALRYSAPADTFVKYLPVFEQVTKRFYPGR